MDKALYRRIDRELDRRHLEGLVRSTRRFEHSTSLDLSSNSYLDMHNNPAVNSEALRLCGGRLSGSTASRLIKVTSALADELEAEIADWEESEVALLFTTGYTANLGILSAIAGRSTEIFSDRLNHASIIDGIILSGGKLTRYRHNDTAHLAELLEKSTHAEKVIVTDSIFSMDGDVAPLVELADLAERFGAMFMVDEAHATGLFGERGSGLCEALGVKNRVDIRMGTLSKAIGGSGGFCVVSKKLRSYLVNRAGSQIYSTGMSDATLAFALASVRHIRKHSEERVRLAFLSEKLRNALTSAGVDILQTTTQIIPVNCATPERAVALSSALLREGITAPAIRPPTVPTGTARVRLTLHSGLTEGDIDFIGEAVIRNSCHG